MSTEKLKPCPLPLCGGEASEWGTTERQGCSVKGCYLADHFISVELRQALPRHSEAVQEVERDMLRVVDIPPGQLDGWSSEEWLDNVNGWRSRLASAAPGMGTPGSVWGTLGPSGYVLQVFAARQQAEEYIADREDSHGWTVEEIVVRGAQPKADAGEKIEVRAGCRKRMPLDGADAQALEHALTITERERDKFKQQAEQDYAVRTEAIAERDTAIAALDEARTERDRYFNALDKTRGELTAAKALAKKRWEQILAHAARYDTARADAEKARGERDEFERRLDIMREKKKRAEESCCEEMDEVSTLREQLGEATMLLDKSSSALSGTSGRLIEMRAERDALAETVKELEEIFEAAGYACSVCDTLPRIAPLSRSLYCDTPCEDERAYSPREWIRKHPDAPTTTEGETCADCQHWIGGAIRGRCGHELHESHPSDPASECEDYDPAERLERNKEDGDDRCGDSVPALGTRGSVPVGVDSKRETKAPASQSVALEERRLCAHRIEEYALNTEEGFGWHMGKHERKSWDAVVRFMQAVNASLDYLEDK